MRSDVVAVILNWNCAEETIRCLRAVATGTAVPDIIVVDNGSEDDSLARLALVEEPFTLVELDSNLGFAGGMNAGIRAAHARGAEWVWVLNADAVPRPAALAALLEHTGRFAASASRQVTSLRPDDPETESYLVAAMLPNGRVEPFRCSGCAEGPHEVDVVTGAALFLSVPWVMRVGLFDERFFHYKEEFDLVHRIAAAGGKVGLVCASEVWHLRGGSLNTASARAQYYHYRNEILFVRKHYSRPLKRMLLSEPIHYKTLTRSVLGAAVGNHEQRSRSIAVLAAYWDGVRGVEGPTERF
ncbi:glycosyltransferase family 2 protein [Dactylosporangium sp. CS-033363]|uniref:glycosyltransferase family 2 protein n=1 Tax=Dactylosporangium sp. CS-033363 TaxID=3239935 RepID=UPI003D8B771C